MRNNHKCNRSACVASGKYPHVDIVVGHDGKEALYCEACANLINRANKPMAGFHLVPTDSIEVYDALRVKLANGLDADSAVTLGVRLMKHHEQNLAANRDEVRAYLNRMARS